MLSADLHGNTKRSPRPCTNLIFGYGKYPNTVDFRLEKIMSCDEAKGAKTLAAVGFDAVRLFRSLENVAIADYKGLDEDRLIQQQQRFDLWATNIGLHQQGHASLDYRFRDAPDIYHFCRTLLEDLVEALEICT